MGFTHPTFAEAATDTPLPEIDALVAEVETVKAGAKEALRAEAAAALARLKAVDEDGWREVRGG
ncbi:hypothetical protein [Yoonia sp.]|uniref:hypothetical protein n=1 Tax=Yoonia sp. TaxID=2212373 RepID=UPI002E06E9EA|nr:hypothetical protein [Yoonia sp.]